MALVCAQCSRVNPPEAAYCYHDGTALAGRSGGPLNPGSALFPTPFVFPNGQACRNFDQLSITCQQNWAAALDLLKQGFLASFFGGLGRVDLAHAAQEAAKFPDPDRGLDQLLSKIPSHVVEPPKLQAEPTDVNLGQLPLGTDRAIELHLRNTGMRLLYGSIASDSKWLMLGEAPGQPQKVFQFGDETVIPVQIRGQHLRAGVRPLEGHLAIDSNGGTYTITVRADVPVKAFAGGLFEGATTPRQVAEKAKANAKEAVPFFADGRVAAWFQSNGWTYPVQGPLMPGTGAVQQFFEALGVARPPQVRVNPPSFQLEGKPGKLVQFTVEVVSNERKLVYGWAACDCPWVAIGKTKLGGRVATIPVTITIPDRAGTQVAQLTVVGNGQRRFTVPLSVAVIGGSEVDAEMTEIISDEPVQAEVLNAELVDETLQAEIVEEPLVAAAPATRPAPAAATVPAAPVPAVASVSTAPAPRPPSTPVVALDPPPRAAAPPPRPPSTPVVALESPAKPIAPTVSTPPALVSPGLGEEIMSFGDGPGPNGPPAPESDLDLAPAGSLVSRPASMIGSAGARRGSRVIHFVPLAFLLLALMGTCVHDALVYFFRPATAATLERPLLVVNFDYNFDTKKVDKERTNSMMAGLVRNDPDQSKTAVSKKLTYGKFGHTNSLVLKIDGKDRIFSDISRNGRWYTKPKKTEPGKFPEGTICEFEFLPERIVVRQEVGLVHGEPVVVGPIESKRLLDTCLFRYKIENHDGQAHDVGMRFLLDTYIGSNDQVPFTLPGVKGMVDDSREMKADDVPDFIQVLENPDLKKPELIAQLNLRLGDKYETPNRVKLTAHPIVQRGAEPLSKDTWEIPLASIKEAQDSCVVLYWDPAKLGAGQHRDMAFTYGLGNVSIGPTAKLGLTVGGAMLVGNDLTVVALVADPQPDQQVELTLQPGLTLAKESPIVQLVPASVEKDGKRLPSPVTWRVRAQREGDYTIVVETRIGGESVTQSRRIKIAQVKLF
jgi:hypothetical protein